MDKERPNILIITGRYLPGYKDGGPVRSIKNIVDYLGHEYNFMIFTADRDHGDTKPYENIKINKWNSVGGAQVYYVRPKGFSLNRIIKLTNQADLVYVCGCFNDYSIKTLLLKRLGLIKKPVVVASMGLFSPMEFKLKYNKKKLFTTVFNLTGMFRKIYWSATSQMEINEIKQQVYTHNNFFIAEDLPRKVTETSIIKKKKKGELEVVWISRITQKKNLIGAIRILQKVNSKVNFTIYGPVHVKEYWEKCKDELNNLPENISWKYLGDLESEQVVEKLKKHHLFLFPTLGENYGHVIQEAMSAGCPCLISDQTPWHDLEENGAGKIHSIENIREFARDIDNYASLSESEYFMESKKVHSYAIEKSNYKVKNTGYRKIFGSGDLL